MIDQTLKFLADEINLYLAQQPGLSLGDASLVLGNASRIFDTDPNSGDNNLQNRAIISLVNVEEDRISRSHEPFTRTITGVEYAEPPVFLNLYVLFVVNMRNHEAATRWLSAIIRFFQHQSVFTPLSHPALNPAIPQLSAAMQSLSFEQANQLWSTLGGKYLPSVLYKIRQISVDEGAAMTGAGYIRSVTINDRTKQPIS